MLAGRDVIPSPVANPQNSLSGDVTDTAVRLLPFQLPLCSLVVYVPEAQAVIRMHSMHS